MISKRAKLLARGVLAVFAMIAATGILSIFFRGSLFWQPLEQGPGAAHADFKGTRIVLSQDGSTFSGDGVSVDGNRITVSKGGEYLLSGFLEGQICVNAADRDRVVLRLAGVEIVNRQEPAVYVENAEETLICLEEGTSNLVESGSRENGDFQKKDSEEDRSGAAVYAKDDLSIMGTGSLKVFGCINNGIHTKNDLSIEGGEIEIKAWNNGIKGKDSVSVTGGKIQVESGGDGIQSDSVIDIAGGVFALDAGEDGIHADGSVHIAGGEIAITSAGKGIHGDQSVSIAGGEIEIADSEEGLEANQVLIEEGVIRITASDDGINANGEPSEKVEMPCLTISGGEVWVNAMGDGLDSNGNIFIEGGTVMVEGPSDDLNGPIDYGYENGGICQVSGGKVLAVGSSGMAETFDGDSAQCSFRHIFDSGYPAGSEILISDSAGNILCRYTSLKEGASVVFSSPELALSETYLLSAGGMEAEITMDSMSTLSGRREVRRHK